jgi:UDP-N-acetyl-D-galactosamine dehydrogenase
VIRELLTYGVKVHVHDPIASSQECEHEYGVKLTPWEQLPQAQAVVAAVSHREYTEMGAKQLGVKLVPNGIFVDVKASYDQDELVRLGFVGWRL